MASRTMLMVRLFKTLLGLLLVSIFLLLMPGMTPVAAAGPAHPIVKVGVSQDPPLVWVDDSGEVRGFFPDLLEDVARREGWLIHYVPGSWCKTLENLTTAQIDLLPGYYPASELYEQVALSRESVMIDWGQLYASKSSKIQTILDLEGKTVAVQSGCVFYEGEHGLRSVADKFNVHINFVSFDDLTTVLAQLRAGDVDAVTLGRFYNNLEELSPDIIKTPVLFSPITLHFAASGQNGRQYLDVIDRYLREIKEDRSSIYYRSWDKWFSASFAPILPSWFIPVVASLSCLALLLLGFSLFAKRQVEKKTREISKKNSQLRSLSMELTLAEAKERRQLAELLHDDLGQNLALAKFRLASVSMPDDPEWSSGPLVEVRGFINDAIRTIRSLTSEVSPPALYNLSFLASIQWLADHTLHSNGVKSEVVSNGNGFNLPEDTKVLLFKTVRELLVNIVKHAKASYVRIDLRCDETTLLIQVWDDGVGLPEGDFLKKCRTKECFGLLSIRERLTYLGGEFAVKNASPQGTLATLRVPMALNESEES